MQRLKIFATVDERNQNQREYLLEQLNKLGIVPRILGPDKIEFRYEGDRKTVLEIGEIACNFVAHSVHIWSD